MAARFATLLTVVRWDGEPGGRYGPALPSRTAHSPAGSSTRLPVMLVGEPHEWPESKSRKHLDPTLVLFTTEKAIRF